MTAPTEQTLFEVLKPLIKSSEYLKAQWFIHPDIQTICAKFEQWLAEAEAKLAQAQSIIAQKDLALAAAKELLAGAEAERDDLQKRMKGIRNVLGTITPSIAPLTVVLIAEAAMEITAPVGEKT